MTRVRAVDPHSFARPEEARVRHVSLELVVDFEARSLRGSASLDVVVEQGGTELVLDTRRLAVERVVDDAGRALAFSLTGADPVLGEALVIQLGDTTTAFPADALEALLRG